MSSINDPAKDTQIDPRSSDFLRIKNSADQPFRFFGKNSKNPKKQHSATQGQVTDTGQSSDSSTHFNHATTSIDTRKQGSWIGSKHRFQRRVFNEIEELELYLGRAQQVGYLSGTNGKEVIFKRIIELLAKHEHLRTYRSPTYKQRTAIELAVDLNSAGTLDKEIEALHRVGCHYHPDYEKKLPQKLRKNKIDPNVAEPENSPYSYRPTARR